MATYTSNYAWTKPGGNDQVNISVLNGNLDSQDAIMHKAFVNMAQAFSQLSTYAVGDIVLYDNDLYKCHTAVTVAGAWTGSTNWTSWTLAEGGGGGGTSDYSDLTNKPSINGVTLSGNKTTSDLGIDKTAVGLGNVPNVSTNDQTPTFSQASTRNNIASGEKLSVILGKVQKFFNDLKTVAFSGNASDLNYDNTTSGLSATKTQDAIDELNGKIGKKTILATVTADGIKTNSELLNGLYPYRRAGAIINISDYHIFNTRFTTVYGCTACSDDGTPFLVSAVLKASGSVMKVYNTTSGTITDMSATVPASGSIIELYIQT